MAWAFTLAPQNVGIGLAILAGIIFRSVRLKSCQARKAKLAFYTSRVTDFNICPFPDG